MFSDRLFRQRCGSAHSIPFQKRRNLLPLQCFFKCLKKNIKKQCTRTVDCAIPKEVKVWWFNIWLPQKWTNKFLNQTILRWRSASLSPCCFTLFSTSEHSGNCEEIDFREGSLEVYSIPPPPAYLFLGKHWWLYDAWGCCLLPPHSLSISKNHRGTYSWVTPVFLLSMWMAQKEKMEKKMEKNYWMKAWQSKQIFLLLPAIRIKLANTYPK